MLSVKVLQVLKACIASAISMWFLSQIFKCMFPGQQLHTVVHLHLLLTPATVVWTPQGIINIHLHKYISSSGFEVDNCSIKQLKIINDGLHPVPTFSRAPLRRRPALQQDSPPPLDALRPLVNYSSPTPQVNASN